MRLIRQFKREIRCADGRLILILAVGSLLLGMLSALVGGGHACYYRLCLPRFAPSAFGCFVIWTVFYLALGCAAGLALSAPCCCKGKMFRQCAHSGIWLWGLGMLLNFMWFPLFFGVGSRLFSLLLIVGMLFLALLTAFAFARTSLLAALIMTVYFVWLFFCFILQIAVILCN